jgi:hypothetical protein
LIAQSAEIRGKITASTFEGGTITGALIRTALTGDRIELTPDGFNFFDSGNAIRVSLGTNQVAGISGHTYYNSNRQSQGLIYAVSNELHVIGNSGLRLGASFGRISFQGALDFNSAPTVYGFTVDKVEGLSSRLSTIDSSLSGKANTSESGYNLTFDTVSRNLKMFSKSGALLAQVNIPK